MAARGCAALALCLAIVALPAVVNAAPQERLCDWLSGIGEAAQAQSEREFGRAAAAARRALAARPRGAAAARAQAALGLALAAEGAPGDAAEALETALGSAIPARAHLAFARGEALLAAGNAPHAARLFAEAAQANDLALAPNARLREAQALLAAGLAPDAAAILEALLRGPLDLETSARARLAFAHALAASGDRARAAETLRALWLDAPERPEGVTAGQTLASWRSAGRPAAPDAAGDHLTRAERLLATGRPEEALVAIAEAERADEPEPASERAAGLRAAALLALGRHADAERGALALVGSSDAAIQRGARLVLARVAARDGRVDEATQFYADVAAAAAPVAWLPEWRQRDLGDEAAFLVAWLPYDAGAFERAIPLLEAFARKHPRSRRAEDALWFAAWSRYRLGRFADAERALAKLSKGPLADQALYWRARLAPGRARQKALYRASLASSAGGWYALLARARLAALGAPASRPAHPAARPLPEVKDPAAAARLSVAVELLGLGLREAALAELRDLARGARARPAAPLVAQLADFAEDPELPFRMARDHLLPSRRVLRWAYPEPYAEAVGRAAAGVGVDRALVLAVMRRESSFRRVVRSGAGAEGLLQVLPSTAERVATVLGLPAGASARLDDADTNVALGAHYLALLLSRFGDPALAVAAYNAGPRPVAEWALAREGAPLDAWIESIPYRETRQYVKVVLSEWDIYRALAGEPAPPLDPMRAAPAPKAGVAF